MKAAEKTTPKTSEKRGGLTSPPESTLFRDPRTFCWCCQKVGVEERNVRWQFLLNCQAVEATGRVPNVLDLEDPVWQKTRDDLGGRAIVKVFSIDKDYPDWKIRQLCKKDHVSFDTVRLGRIIVLCTECAKEYEFNWEKETCHK